VTMNAKRAVLAAVFEVPAIEVPAIMTDHTARIVPPPMSALPRGRTSDTQTATQLEGIAGLMRSQ
jgi:hypothetical protein